MGSTNRGGVLAVLVMLMAMTTACDPGSGVSVPDDGDYSIITGPLAALMGCSLSQSFCEDLEDAIAVLQDHPDAACRELGDNARDRFESGEGAGYVPSDTTGFDAYTKMQGSGSSWIPVDGYVYVDEAAWNGYDENDLIYQLIAHEEQHHNGWAPNHSNWSNVCEGNPA